MSLRVIPRVLAATLPLLSVAATAGAEHVVWYFDEPQSLRISTGEVAVLERSRTLVGADEFASRRGLAVRGWSIVSMQGEPDGPATARFVTGLARDDRVDFVSPVFVDDFGGPLIVTPDILVRFEPDVTPAAAETVLWRAGVGVIIERDAAGLDGVFRVRSGARDGFGVLEAAGALAARHDVVFAEPDMIFSGRPHLVPDDPFFDLAWGIHNTGQPSGCLGIAGVPGVDMNGPEAWDITTGDPAVTVVVIDGGYELGHPDLNHGGFAMDFTGEGDGGPVHACDNHGTIVAGCIAGIIDNATDGMGIAPGCTIASARVLIPDALDPPCGASFMTQASWTASALTWARDTVGARVTCNSNGYGFLSAVITTAYTETLGDGIVHFASAGDGGTGLDYPASLPAVNGVTAIDRFGALAPGANTGAGLVLTAPGEDIVTTDRTGPAGLNGSSAVCVSGTSLAAPYAAGVAALVVSGNDGLTAGETQTALYDTALDLGAPGLDTTWGWGLVDASAAVRSVVSIDCNGNGVDDAEDIGAGTSADCNGNGVPDECDIAGGSSVDCDASGVPDECETDCNGNGVLDACDIASGTSVDFDVNGIPDECDPDCNANGQPDFIDIAFGMSDDCNGNGVPDECDLFAAVTVASPPLSPFDAVVPQTFVVTAPPGARGDVTLSFTAMADLQSSAETVDVGLNGTNVGTVFILGAADCPALPDADTLVVPVATWNSLVGGGDAVLTMQASAGVGAICGAGSFIAVTIDYEAVATSDDCDGNGVPDECDVAGGAGADCNGNGVLDSCDIGAGTSPDFNGDGVPDECNDDCNANGIPDFLDLLFGASQDCNGSGVPDECENDCDGNGLDDSCDIAAGAPDCDGNGVIDGCEIATGAAGDCNGNGVPDGCDVVVPFTADSGPLSPIGFASPQSYTVAGPPVAVDEVTLEFTVVGDVSAPSEFLDVELNGVDLGSVFVTGAGLCSDPPDVDQITVAAAVFNALVGGGDAVVDLVASPGVLPNVCLPSTYVTVRVAYPAVGPDDDDGDGVPNGCSRPPNDSCGSATPVGDGTHAFSSHLAASDGPDEPSVCLFPGGGSVPADVWFVWTAACDGQLEISLSNLTYPARLAVYDDACPVGPDEAVACMQAPGGSSLTLPATAGSTRLIRIGGLDGATGVGTLAVTCTATCPADCAAPLDQQVDVADLLELLAAWGQPGAECDVDGDGAVGVADLLDVLAAWGGCG